MPLTNKGGAVEWTEAEVLIEGVPLTFAQSMTLRVALESFAISMAEAGALGPDADGMRENYFDRAREVLRLLHDGRLR